MLLKTSDALSVISHKSPCNKFYFCLRAALSYGRRWRGVMLVVNSYRVARCFGTVVLRVSRPLQKLQIVDGRYTELLALNGFPRTYDREPETVLYGKKYEFRDFFSPPPPPPSSAGRPDGKVNDYNTMLLVVFSIFVCLSFP